MSKGLSTFSRFNRLRERESRSYSRRPQTRQAFEHSAATFLAIYCFCCCFPFSILIGSVGGSSSLLAQTAPIALRSGGSSSASRPPTLTSTPFATTFNSANQISNHEQYPVTTFAPNQPVARLATAVTSASSGNTATTISTTAVGVPQQHQQPKSLKFTLIAGKFWKFNISKTNSFISHKEGELRLHRIISANNYIIDDDNWFQYDPQQQQLFAWPSIATRSTTYYFALLPSGVDIEADSDNTVSLDVVANIIVELIRPLYQGSKNDIDQLIDYKFSLEDLHRHSSYPLLLQQVLSVFDTLATKSNNTIATTTTNNNNNRHNSNSLSTLLKGSKLLSNKLSEFLLINYSYSPDGDFFSLTWSSQPTLANNTISLISECRLANIKDVVVKLSGSTAARLTSQQQQNEEQQQGYYIGDERYVIYYPLDAPLVNSQAIVPKERGNNALRLTLYGPCQSERIIEELGAVGRLANNATVTDIELASEQSPSSGTSPDVEDKVADNTVDLQPAPTLAGIASAASKVASIANTLPGLPSPEAIDSSVTSAQITSSTPSTSTTPLPTDTVLADTANTKFPLTQKTTTTTIVATPPPVPDTTSVGSTKTNASEQIDQANNELQPTIIDLSTEAANDIASAPVLTPSTITTTAATTPAIEARLEQSVQVPPLASQQSKLQPQAKSFANFLESTDNQPTNFTMTTTPKILTTKELTTNSIAPASATMMTTNKTINESSAVPIKEISSESSLNEDFMGILNDVMDYLISVAVPVSIIIGTILIISILIALCSLCIKKKKSKQFQVRNRFNFRYGSERRVFLKNSSKPVILDADRKSLSSLGATPQHRSSKNTPTREQSTGNNNKKDATYLPMQQFSSTEQGDTTFTINR